MATNVRCKSRSPRTAKALATSPDIEHIPASRKKRPAPVTDDADEVRRRIEHLECVIATAPAEHMARRIATRDMLPPSEETMVHRKPAGRRRPMEARARARKRSMGLLVQSLMLALVIAGVAGWLNQRFHFLHQ